MSIDFLESEDQLTTIDFSADTVTIKNFVLPSNVTLTNITSCESATVSSLVVPTLQNPTLPTSANVTTKTLTVNNVTTNLTRANTVTVNTLTTTNATINTLYTGTQIVQTTDSSTVTANSSTSSGLSTLDTVLITVGVVVGVAALVAFGVFTGGIGFAVEGAVGFEVAADVGVSLVDVGGELGIGEGEVFAGAAASAFAFRNSLPTQVYSILSKTFPNLISVATLGRCDPMDLSSEYDDFCKVIYQTVSSSHVPRIISYNLAISDFDSGTAFNNTAAILSLCTNNTTTPYTFRFQTNGDLAIYSSPTVQIWHSNTQISDMRLKRDIEPIEDPTEKLASLDGIFFNYTQAIYGPVDERQVGLIAQQVAEQFPEAVFSAGSVQGIYLEALVPVLIESIKALNAEFETLHERYNALIEYY